MLILMRRQEEAIVIGHEITVKVVEIRGGTVRLGVDAPSHVSVHRREVEAAISRRDAETQGKE